MSRNRFFVTDREYRNSCLGQWFETTANRDDAGRYEAAASRARAQHDHLAAAYNSNLASQYYAAAGDKGKADLQRNEATQDNEDIAEEHKRNRSCCVIS